MKNIKSIKNTTLILAVDGRKFKDPFRDYQMELILCLKAWNGFYDNPIILICPSKFGLDTKTKNTVLKYKNVKYIEDSRYYTEDITCGFDMKALAGKLIQKDYKDILTTDYILNIDLDMYIINPIPEKLFNELNPNTIVGRYTNTQSLKDKINVGIIYIDKDPFDTGFILTHKDSGFFIKWEEDITNIRNVILNNKQIENDHEEVYINTKKHLTKDLQIDSIEEWLISYYDFHKVFDIYSLRDYQYGEWYPEELLSSKAIFYHYHYYENNINEILRHIKKKGNQ